MHISNRVTGIDSDYAIRDTGAVYVLKGYTTLPPFEHDANGRVFVHINSAQSLHVRNWVRLSRSALVEFNATAICREFLTSPQWV